MDFINASLQSTDDNDTSYNPTEDEECEDEPETEDTTAEKIDKTSFLLVSWANILQLLASCRYCGTRTTISKICLRGSSVSVFLSCETEHVYTWRSQPTIRKMALGNLRLVCGTILAGSTYNCLREICEFSKVRIFSHVTFNKIQAKIVRPVVHEFWKDDNERVVQAAISAGHIRVCGDGQCDSPGHSAKYGVYSMMNQDTGHIIGHRVTQVTEAGNSNAMELFGFTRVLKTLEEKGVTISQVTTDRHVSVRKYVIENCENINLQFDIWHVCKSIKKKLADKAKKKSCRVLNDWIKSVTNHLWWCAETCNGSYQLIREKWTSIIHHVIGKHTWTGSKEFHKCEHKPYNPEEDSSTAWLKSGTPAHDALRDVVFDKGILRDLEYLTQFSHTGCLEVYHGLRNKFAPKRLHFSYNGTCMRSELAILDHNSSVELPQARTKTGAARYKLSYTKITKSWVVKPIRQRKNKQVFHDIVSRSEQVQNPDEKLFVPAPPVLPRNIAPTPKPIKLEAIESHRSRGIKYPGK